MLLKFIVHLYNFLKRNIANIANKVIVKKKNKKEITISIIRIPRNSHTQFICIKL